MQVMVDKLVFVFLLSLLQGAEAICYGYCVYSMWYFWFGLFWMVVVIVVLIVSCIKKKKMYRRQVRNMRIPPPRMAVATVTGPGYPHGGAPVKPMAPPDYEAVSAPPPAYGSIMAYPPSQGMGMAPSYPPQGGAVPPAYPPQGGAVPPAYPPPGGADQMAYPPPNGGNQAPYPPGLPEPAYPPPAAPNYNSSEGNSNPTFTTDTGETRTYPPTVSN